MNEQPFAIPAKSFCEYLAERYEEPFVQAVSTGAFSDRHDRYESFPMLDGIGNRITTAAILYMATKVYEDMAKIGDDFQRSLARENWDKAALQLAESRKALAAATEDVTKEMGRRREERATKRERQRDQPWRRGHA